MQNKEHIGPSEGKELIQMKTGSHVQQVAGLATLAAAPVEVASQRSRHVMAIGGDLKTVEKEIPSRNHTADTAEALQLLEIDESVVWHSNNTVVMVIDDSYKSYREDRVTWNLSPTDAWGLLSRGIHNESQKSLVRLLENDLREIIAYQAPGLLEAVRNIQFVKSSEATGHLQQGKESMGRAVKAEVTGATDIPKQVELRVRRWAEIDHTATLLMQVYVDLDSETFTVQAPGDVVVAAEIEAQGSLSKHLSERLVTAKVVAGTP